MKLIATLFLVAWSFSHSFGQCDTLTFQNNLQHCLGAKGTVDLSKSEVNKTGVWTCTQPNALNGKILDLSKLAKASTLYYTISNPKPGCLKVDSVKIIINPLPQVSISKLPSLCTNANQMDLNFYGFPKGSTGYWGDTSSANMINKVGSQYKLDPQKGLQQAGKVNSHYIYYRYTDAKGCTDSTFGEIKIKPLPKIVLTKQLDSINPKGGLLNLDPYVVSPKGGVWEAPLGIESSVFMTDINNDGIKEWVFDPKKAAAPGPKTLYYHFTDNKLAPQPPSCSNSIEFVLVVDRNYVVSTEMTEEILFNFYPNPTTGLIQIVTGNSQPYVLNIADLTGRLLYSEYNLKPNASIDLSDIAPGVYIISISQNGQTRTSRLIKN